MQPLPSTRSLLVGFLIRFVVIYGLLLVPWPGWRGAYSSYLRGLGNLSLARDDARGAIRFHPADPSSPPIDTAVAFAPVLRDSLERAPVHIVGLDSRGVGWVPTALCCALVLATPLPWVRRLGALLVAWIVTQLYLVLVLAALLWNQSEGLLPMAFLPFNASIGNGLQETLVAQIGPSFAVPALIWIAVVGSAFTRRTSAA